MTDSRTYTGGCHCGMVRFECTTDMAMVTACNCSICTKKGILHLPVAAERLEILSGAADLTTYTFNTGVARHLFCSVCGVKSFYRPRSNPDGWSVNARCLDGRDDLDIAVAPFDGRDWERHGADLAHLSKEAP